MKWRRESEWHSVSDAGYVVARVVVRDAVAYMAYAPPIDDATFRSRLRVHYEHGAGVPTRRECIGVFGSGAEAATACRAHKLEIVNEAA